MIPNRNEAGFSLIKMLLVLAILGGALRVGYLILPAYSVYWKVQDTFESLTRNLSNLSESAIRGRLPDALHVQGLLPSDLPQAFYDHLNIQADGTHLEISSDYHVAVWLLGKPERVDRSVNKTDLQGVEKLQYRGRMVFHFHPYAKTP